MHRASSFGRRVTKSLIETDGFSPMEVLAVAFAINYLFDALAESDDLQVRAGTIVTDIILGS